MNKAQDFLTEIGKEKVEEANEEKLVKSIYSRMQNVGTYILDGSDKDSINIKDGKNTYKVTVKQTR